MNHFTEAGRNCLYVTGFPQDYDRKTLRNEFLRFGNVEKLFLEQSGSFAKVYFSEKESCDLAINILNKSAPHWRVEYSKSKTTENKSEPSSSVNSLGVNSMAGYNDDYEPDDLEENFDYCNIHGQALTVLQAESGDLYINLKDIRKTGFALFRRDTFDTILVDKRQIGKEFELHLLSEAKNYILKNRVGVIDEDQILKTIERCKTKLLGETNHENRNNFGPHRSVVQSPNNNLTIKSDVQQITPSPKYPQQPQNRQRHPKAPPNKFYSSNSQQGVGSRYQGHEESLKSGQNNEHTDRTGSNHFQVKDKERNGDKGYSDQDVNTSSSSNSPRYRSTHREQNSTQPKEDIGQTSFEIGHSYDVHVAFNEKEQICWVQNRKDAGILEDIFVKINEMEPNLEQVKPVIGHLVTAMYEGVWNRARVIKLDPLMVHFIDFGNKSKVDCVKHLPDTFRTTPAFAVRIKICQSFHLGDMTDLIIKVKQKYDDHDGTHLVELLNENLQKIDTSVKAAKSEEQKPEEVKRPVNVKKAVNEKKTEEVLQPEEPKPICYYDIPKPMAELQNGDKIMLIDVEANKFLVRTRQCANKCKELTEYIKSLDKTALILSNVKVGQIVLASKDGLVGLYRAVITDKESGLVVTVKYIDFPGEDTLSVKSLRNVDKVLATEPATILLTPEYSELKDANEAVLDYVQKLCQDREKFTVVVSGDDFDLKFEDATLLSKKLHDLKFPKSKPEKLESEPSTSKQTEKIDEAPEIKSSTLIEKVLYDEMNWIKIEPGSHTFMCYSVQGVSEVTMISSSEEVINHLSSITGLEVADNEPYRPEEFEMCLVSYKGPQDDEASWYRAVVIEVKGDDYYVNFVDFGNEETVKSLDIRKFPTFLKDVPVLAISCECVGLPDKPEVVKRLKELIPEWEQVEVVVKELKDLKYLIEIPDVYKKLKSEGLY